MVVATCEIRLQLEGVYSLKDKRRIVKSILARLPQQFNIAVAEVDCQDIWRTAVIALVTVGTDASYLHKQLEKAVEWIEAHRPDAPIAEYQIQFV